MPSCPRGWRISRAFDASEKLSDGSDSFGVHLVGRAATGYETRFGYLISVMRYRQPVNEITFIECDKGIKVASTTIDLTTGLTTLTEPNGDFIATVESGDPNNYTLTFGTPVGGFGNRQITLGTGNNTLVLNGGTDQVMAISGNNSITTTGTGAAAITVGSGNNTLDLQLSDGPNVIAAGNGDNTIRTGLGSSQITVGSGFDSITTFGGNNTISVTLPATAPVTPDAIHGNSTNTTVGGNTLVVATPGIFDASQVDGIQTYRLADGAANTLNLVDSNFVDLPTPTITVFTGDLGGSVNAATLSTGHNLIVHAGTGIGRLAGGSGTNTAIFAGPLSNYTVSRDPTTGALLSVQSNQGLPNTTDTFSGVWNVLFAPVNVLFAPVLTTVSEIVNDATSPITGTAASGSTVTLFSDNMPIGTATADATTGAFAVTMFSTLLALGPNTLSATATSGSATSVASAPINAFDLQQPTLGISTTDFSSADIGAAMGLGAKLAFVGTEAVLLTDSTLSVGLDTTEATIQRLYEGLLGRGNDTGGISAWDALLTAGDSKATIATGFLDSTEYVAIHGTQTDAQFVASLYQGLLGRAPEPAGLAGWTGSLSQGASRGEVTIGIADSDEAKLHLAPTTAQVYVPNAVGTLIHELYETGLGREVELAALPFYKAAFATQTPAQIAAGITGSVEFAADHGGQSNTDYVTSLYHAGLARAPEPQGLASWNALLTSGGAARSDVLLDIATSAEAAAHLTHNLSG